VTPENADRDRAEESLEPNRETIAAMREANEGVGLRSYSSFRELLESID
jgi:hypothetical protein